jgi:hypothetical protein
MGEGVTNILGLLVNLIGAEEKLFILEEPENDIHPGALKALLDLVVESAKNNQFIVTTHSNLVLRKLGGAPGAKIFQVEQSLPDQLPTSTVKEVNSDTESRRALLEDLGYEPSDNDHWEAWLFLEESSAEKIIREYLIKWFVPDLRMRLRTFSARCLSEVTPKFRDFNDIFVFLHLEPSYKNKAWILIDGGPDEAVVLQKLKVVYTKNGWLESQFRQLSEHDFESYYPAKFAERVAEIKRLEKAKRAVAKKELLGDVEKWIVTSEPEAKVEFEKSAQEVVQVLKEIQSSLAKPR